MTPIGIDAVVREMLDAATDRITEDTASVMADSLRRHVPEGPRVVEVTERDYEEAYRLCTGAQIAAGARKQMVLYLNESLNARATPSDTIACRVVKRPVKTVSDLRYPENGNWFCRRSHGWDHLAIVGTAGLQAPKDATAIALHDCESFHGPIIERTTTTEPAPWTADTVPEAGRPYVIYYANKNRGAGDYAARYHNSSALAEEWSHPAHNRIIAWAYIIRDDEIPTFGGPDAAL